MRAALGLALVAGGVVLALMVLHGSTPFGATSAPGGSAPTSGALPAIQNPTATQQTQHFGGLP